MRHAYFKLIVSDAFLSDIDRNPRCSPLWEDVPAPHLCSIKHHFPCVLSLLCFCSPDRVHSCPKAFVLVLVSLQTSQPAYPLQCPPSSRLPSAVGDHCPPFPVILQTWFIFITFAYVALTSVCIHICLCVCLPTRTYVPWKWELDVIPVSRRLLGTERLSNLLNQRVERSPCLHEPYSFGESWQPWAVFIGKDFKALSAGPHREWQLAQLKVKWYGLGI